MPPKLILIDAYAQIFRSFYAVRALTNSKGEPSNAVFAMTKFLLKIKDVFEGCDGAFFFDSGRPPHRMEIAPLYKANRAPMPDDLKKQMPMIKELIRAFGWPEIEFENWEADDLIACAAKRFDSRECVIVSADKDLAQLIDDRVSMLVPDQTGKGFAPRTEKETREKFGVAPSMIVDYLALIGDASDNIPGIEGVGPKTAAELLNTFGSIDEIISRASEIKREKLREKISSGAGLLHKNIKLVELVSTPPEDSSWSDDTFKRSEPDYVKILSFAEEMELKSLIKELSLYVPSASTCNDPACAGSSQQLEQLELF